MSSNNVGHLITKTTIVLYCTVRDVFESKVVQNIKTHTVRSIIFFFFENLTFYDVMWRNGVEPGGPQNTIWRMHIFLLGT